MRIASAMALVALASAFVVGCERGKERAGETTVTNAPVTATPTQPAPAQNPQPTIEPTPSTVDTTPATPTNPRAADPTALPNDTSGRVGGGPVHTTPKANANIGAATGTTTTTKKGGHAPGTYACAGNKVSFQGPGRPFCANVCRNSADCPVGKCDAAGTSVDRDGTVSQGSKYCSATKK